MRISFVTVFFVIAMVGFGLAWLVGQYPRLSGQTAAIIKSDPTINMDVDQIAKELDALHETARKAYAARDLKGYRALFTDDLRYVPLNGKPINLQQLMADVAKQLSQFNTVNSEQNRETLTLNNNGTVTAVIQQNATYSTSRFFLFSKEWQIERRGKYVFRKTDNGWRIAEVEILSETVQ